MTNSHGSSAYGADQFALRLARLQRIPSQLGVQALLFIAGQDGNENIGAARAIAYLMHGRSGRDVLDTTSVDPDFEDLVVLVRPDSVSIYTGARGYARVASLCIPHTRNLHVVTPPFDMEDTDDLEAHKVGSFVQMLRGITSVAIPLESDPLHAGTDRRGIEGWPLVQAFGLDGVGRPGFFSMNFKVADASAAVTQCVLQLDTTAVQRLLRHDVPAFMEAWEDQSALLSLPTPHDRKPVEMLRASVTERQLEEPLLAVYAHDAARLPAGVKESELPRPRVRVGVRSNESDESGSPDVTLGLAQDGTALHYTAETSDPRSGLYAGRTYFLARGQYDWAALKKAGFDTSMYEDDLEDPSQGLPSDDPSLTPSLAALLAAYQGLIEGMDAVIRPALTASHTPIDPASLRQALAVFLLSKLQALGLRCTPDTLQEALTLQLCSSDCAGNALAVGADRAPVAVRMELKRVGLVDGGAGMLLPAGVGEEMGTVVYGETFLLVPDKGIMPLTTLVPRLRCWSVRSAEADPEHLLHKHCTRVLAQAAAPPPTTSTAILSFSSLSGTGTLGKPVNFGGDDCTFLFPTPLLPAAHGVLHAYTAGFMLITKTHAPLVINLAADVESVRLVTAAGHRELLVMRSRRPLLGLSLSHALPYTHDDAVKLNYVALDLGSLSVNARKEFSRSVLSAWERECRIQSIPWSAHPEGLPLSTTDTDQDEYVAAAFVHRLTHGDTPLTRLQKATALADGKAFPCEMSDDRVRALTAQFDSTEILRAVSTPSAALVPHFTKGGDVSPGVPIWIVLGLPIGTGVEDVVACFLRRPVASAWVSAPLPGGCSDGHLAELNASLDLALKSVAAKGGAAGSASSSAYAQPTVVLACATLTAADDVIDFVIKSDCVRTHRAHVKCVTTVVDCRIASESPGVFLASTLEHVIAPWTDHVVLLGDEGVATTLQKSLVKSRCPTASKIVKVDDERALGRDLEALFVGPERKLGVEDAAALARLKRLTPPVARTPAVTAERVRQTLLGPLECLVLRFTGVTDGDKLAQEIRHAVKELQPPAPGLPPLQDTPEGQLRLMSAKAVVRPNRTDASALVFITSMQGTEAVVTRSGYHVGELARTYGQASHATAVPPSGVFSVAEGEHAFLASLAWLEQQGPQTPAGVLMLTGSGLGTKNFRTLIERCAPWKPSSLAQAKLKDLKTLTIAEKREIQKLCVDDPLPDGYVFDGFVYRDAFGDDLGEYHPNFNSRAKQWIDKKNSELLERNRAEEAEHARDCVRFVH